MRQPIEITRGRSYDIALEITDENGNGYGLSGSEVILFGIKREPEKDEKPIFCRAAVAGSAAGSYTVSIRPEDTIDLSPGRYYYDVGLESGGNYYDIIEPSGFLLLPNVTKKGDAYD